MECKMPMIQMNLYLLSHSINMNQVSILELVLSQISHPKLKVTLATFHYMHHTVIKHLYMLLISK